MRLTFLFAGLVTGFSALMAMAVSALAMPQDAAGQGAYLPVASVIAAKQPEVIEIRVHPSELAACRATLAQVLNPGGAMGGSGADMQLASVSGQPLPVARCVALPG